MPVLVAIVVLALIIAVLAVAARGLGPAVLLLGGVAVGSLAVVSVVMAVVGGFRFVDASRDQPTEAFLNDVLLWFGLAGVVAAVPLVIAGLVWAARRESQRIRRSARD